MVLLIRAVLHLVALVVLLVFIMALTRALLRSGTAEQSMRSDAVMASAVAMQPSALRGPQRPATRALHDLRSTSWMPTQATPTTVSDLEAQLTRLRDTDHTLASGMNDMKRDIANLRNLIIASALALALTLFLALLASAFSSIPTALRQWM